jgi:hypothetical protein
MISKLCDRVTICTGCLQQVLDELLGEGGQPVDYGSLYWMPSADRMRAGNSELSFTAGIPFFKCKVKCLTLKMYCFLFKTLPQLSVSTGNDISRPCMLITYGALFVLPNIYWHLKPRNVF